MTHPVFRLRERYGLIVTETEVEALAYMVSRNLVPWKVLCRGQGSALVIQVMTWGRKLYAVYCPVRECILTFLTRKQATRYAR